MLVVVLCFGDVNVARAEDEPTDNEKAIAIIDGFIKEMEELGYESFNDEVINKQLSDSYLWAARLENAKENIVIDNFGYSLYKFCDDLEYYGNGIKTYVYDYDKYNHKYKYNSYNYYYTQLLFIEEFLQGKTTYSLSDLINKGKALTEDYNTIDNYMWLREVSFALNNRFSDYNLYKVASKTYIWDTLVINENKITGYYEGKYNEEKDDYEINYVSKSKRMDDFITCLKLINNELENPFMHAMTVNVKVDKTTYDKYKEQKLNVTPAKPSNNSKTTTTTKKKVAVNVSVAGKKVSNMKLVAKKRKIKVVFAAMPNATKYQIQVATNKKFKKAMKYTVTKPTKTIKKLKRNKVYYVRVRAISGSTKSKWVKKKIRTK